MQPPEEEASARAVVAPASAEGLATQPIFPSIQLWRTWLGVSALLALSGFIVKIAREQFLGISLMQWGPAELSTTAGRWLIDTVLLACQVCIQHPVLTAVWASLVLAPIVISLEFRQDSAVFRASRAIIVALSFISLSLILIRVQLPLTTLEGWLTTSLGDRFSSGPLGSELPSAINSSMPGCVLPNMEASNSDVSHCKQPGRVPLTSRYFRDEQLYFNREIFLSKAAGIGPCVTAEPKGLPVELQMPAGSKDDWPKRAETSEQILQDDYVLELACCLGAWLVLSLQRSSLVIVGFERAIDVLTLFVSFFLLPLCTLLVPYSYGKLIGSTYFTSTTVQQKVHTAEVGGPYFMIERSDSLISVLSLEGGIPKITVFRNDQVASMELAGKVDVIKTWNDHCWFNPVHPPPL